MAARKQTPNFEKRLKELEKLVETLEAGGLSLDDSLKSFEKGIQITRECQQALNNAEQKVNMLTTNEQGQFNITPLDATE